jgi:hypothetical protein
MKEIKFCDWRYRYSLEKELYALRSLRYSYKNYVELANKAISDSLDNAILYRYLLIKILCPNKIYRI